MESNTVILFIGIGINLLVTAIVGTWKLSRVELAIRQSIASSRAEIDERIEAIRREFGETGHALREKIAQVELYTRDTFVRRDSFYKVSDDLAAKLTAMDDKIDKRLERMEGKIDSKT